MNRRALAFAFVTTTIVGNLSFAVANEKLSLTRRLIVEVCDPDGQCHELPQATGATEATEIAIVELSTFRKGGATGVHGEDKLQILKDGVPFKSEIFINKGKAGYSVYAVLRSGKGTKRNGVTKKILLETVPEFKPVTIADAPITIDGREYRARLVIESLSKN